MSQFSSREFVKKMLFRHTRIGAPSYPYCIEPMQLACIINEIERVKTIEGAMVEIGVARGMTTRFICEHIVHQGLANSTHFFAIDTFSSFTPKDIEFEVGERGKHRSSLNGFAYNDYSVWAKNFKKYPFVTAIQADCSTFDYGSLPPIKFAFLDVDLYLPTINALPNLYHSIVSGGVILIDDVMDNSIYDGAFQAYMEFCKRIDIEPIVIGNRCGVIYKP
jgi:Macrocin-O-methyltransferase (TylF)